VLVVPQRPTDQLGGYLEGTVGDYNLVRLQGAINVPLSDTVRLRLSGDRETRKGYLHNVKGVGPDDFGDVNYYAIRGSLVIDLTPDLENYTVATYNHSGTHGSGIPKPFSYGYAGFTGGLLTPEIKAQIAATPGFYDVSNNVPNPLEQIEQWQVINNTTWKASDTITLKNIISYAQFRERQSASIYGDNGYFSSGSFSLANPNFFTTNVVALPGQYNAAESTFTEEFQIQGRTADDRLNYQAGIYHEQSNPLGGYQQSYSPTFISCSDPVALQCTDSLHFGSISNSRSQYKFRDTALFAQATFKIANQLSLTGGFRYTWDTSRGLGDAILIKFPTPNVPSYSCAQPAGLVAGGTSAAILADSSLCSYTREQKSSEPTWLIDLDYKPVENVMLYAKYARGYRQGGINVSSYGLETWNPEKVDLYEIGAKTSWGGAMPGHFNIAGFYNDFSNQLVAVGLVACTAITGPGTQCPFIPSSAQGFANAGKSTIKGVEIDAAIEPFKGLRIEGSYSHLDARINSITPPPAPLGFIAEAIVQQGSPIPLVPKNQIVLTGTYTLPLAPSVGLVSIGITYSHRDSTFGNTSSNTDPITLQNLQILPPQDLVNLNVNWNEVGGMPLDLAFFVTNLTKEKFYTYTVGKSFGFDSYIANQPRMFGVRAKYRFGS
jgi:iron complex outermembrane receptor protein